MTFFHPDMLDRLLVFFPAACTIKERNEVQDPLTGEITYTWTDLPGHVAMPCSCGPSGGVEVKLPDQTYVVSNYAVALAQYTTAIDETMHAVVDGKVYEILLVQNDSHGSKTRLLVRKVE